MKLSDLPNAQVQIDHWAREYVELRTKRQQGMAGDQYQPPGESREIFSQSCLETTEQADKPKTNGRP